MAEFIARRRAEIERDGSSMARDPRHDILFEPVRIGPKTLRNRFYQMPHCTGFGVEKPWTQARLPGHEGRGRLGGGQHRVLLDQPRVGREALVSARLWDDEDARKLSLMVDAAHEHGALAGVELWHGGLFAEHRESRLPPLAPSPVRQRLRRHHRAQGDGRAPTSAASRTTTWRPPSGRATPASTSSTSTARTPTCPSQFLSPVFNRRTRRVRRLVREPRPLLARDDRAGARGGRRRLRDRRADRRRHAASRSGVDAGRGACVHPRSPTTWSTSGTSPIGGDARRGPARLGAVALLRAGASAGVVGPGRGGDRQADRRRRPLHRSRHDGRAVIRAGARRHHRRRPAVDLRPVPAAARSRRAATTRSASASAATSASRARSYGMHLVCTQNPTAGEEYRRGWHPERFAPAANADKDVLVVGAGPAGMECAIVLGKARHGARPPGRRAATSSAAPALGHRACPGWASGGADRLPAGPDRQARERSSSIPETRLDAADVLRLRRRDRRLSRPARAGRPTA